MAAIYPSAPVQHAASRLRLQPREGPIMNMNRNWEAQTRARPHGWQRLLVRPDIDSFISLKVIRCVITVISLVLLATDIPRTGLGVQSLKEFYPTTILPGTAIRFGPFNYPIVQIWRQSNESRSEAEVFTGLHDRQPISNVPVWPYQFDTTSIGLRGAVELLNVADFPSSLLYKINVGNSNHRSSVSLSATFTMLDAFISSVQDKLRTADGYFKSLRFATKHNWVDCIHHYVVSFITKNPEWRLHSIQAAQVLKGTQPSSICSATGIGRTSILRPSFCHHPGVWTCSNPPGETQPHVLLWDHMSLRLQLLQRRYPGLELDVVFITSQRLASISGGLRSTFNNYEDLEIVVLTRGRNCDQDKANNLSCATIFVDDYRYERDIVQTNVVDWYNIIAFLRGSAQTYVWIRLVLFAYGAYAATDPMVSGKSASPSRWISVVSIILKIPFQVIVYSSLLPVGGYVLALLLDSGFMDIFLDSRWASVGGPGALKAMSFFQATAVQMRCVWLLAMLATIVLYAVKKTNDHGKNGVLGIRGLLVSFTSSLMVFGPYKNPMFRDVNNVSVILMANGGETRDMIRTSNPSGYFNSKSYLGDDSPKMLLVCIAVICGLTLVIKAVAVLLPRQSTEHNITKEVVLCSTPIVPCGERRLWPMSTLNIQFGVQTISNQLIRGPHASNILAATTPVFDASPVVQDVDVFAFLPRPSACKRAQSPEQQTRRAASNEGIQNGAHHCLRRRTNETSSVLLLMNIAMMTDPWNIFWLRVIGIKLYLYKILCPSPDTSRLQSVTSYAVILPYGQDEMEDFTGLAAHEYELLDSVSSRDVPMHILLQSG